MSSALPFQFDDDAINLNNPNDNLSHSSSTTDDDDSSTTSSYSTSSSENNNAPNQLSSSASSSFLSPPPLVPQSNDTIRASPRNTPLSSSPSMSRYMTSANHNNSTPFVSPSPSPIPSLSSTPTGMGGGESGSFSSRGSISVGMGMNMNMNMNMGRSHSNGRSRSRGNNRSNSANSNDGIVGTFHRLSIDRNDGDNHNYNTADNNYNHDPYNDSNEERSSRIRGGSLFSSSPSTTTPSTTTRHSRSSTTQSSTSNLLGGRIIGLNAGHSTGTILRPTSSGGLSALYERKPQPTKSDKQQPGQRKQRRWNNDKFVGIASEISACQASRNNKEKGMMIANLYAEAEMEKSRYTMPNHPRFNRTVFGTLAAVDYGKTIGGSGGSGGNSRGMDQGQEGLNGDIYDEGIGAKKVAKLNRSELIKVRQRFIDGDV